MSGAAATRSDKRRPGTVRLQRVARPDGQGAVATVVLDAPHRLNALDLAMWRELRAAFARCAGDDALRAIVVRGEGAHFAAGGDIVEFRHRRHDPDSARRYHLDDVVPALDAIRQAGPPVIAAIRGHCIGGGLEIALACDLRVVEAGAGLGIPVGRLGFPLVLPELRLLLARVPAAVAADLLLAGRVFDAPEALAAGLAHRLAPAGDLDAVLEQLLAAVVAGSPLAARVNKARLRREEERSAGPDAAELAASFEPFAAEDYREGIAAFVERRAPRFAGR